MKLAYLILATLFCSLIFLLASDDQTSDCVKKSKWKDWNK